jgi:hypothetical protein
VYVIRKIEEDKREREREEDKIERQSLIRE